MSQFIKLSIEYCINQNTGGFIWSNAKVISIGNNNTELVSDSWPTWFLSKFPLWISHTLAFNSMFYMKHILLLIRITSICMTLSLWSVKLFKINPESTPQRISTIVETRSNDELLLCTSKTIRSKLRTVKC